MATTADDGSTCDGADLFAELFRLYELARPDDYHSKGRWNVQQLRIDLELIEAHRRQAMAPEPPPLSELTVPQPMVAKPPSGPPPLNKLRLAGRFLERSVAGRRASMAASTAGRLGAASRFARPLLPGRATLPTRPGSLASKSPGAIGSKAVPMLPRRPTPALARSSNGVVKTILKNKLRPQQQVPTYSQAVKRSPVYGGASALAKRPVSRAVIGSGPTSPRSQPEVQRRVGSLAGGSSVLSYRGEARNGTFRSPAAGGGLLPKRLAPAPVGRTAGGLTTPRAGAAMNGSASRPGSTSSSFSAARSGGAFSSRPGVAGAGARTPLGASRSPPALPTRPGTLGASRSAPALPTRPGSRPGSLMSARAGATAGSRPAAPTARPYSASTRPTQSFTRPAPYSAGAGRAASRPTAASSTPRRAVGAIGAAPGYLR
eukprot:TRINITY_DN37382_c0_g1_i1.p1 TRINITY_DN37382_c0_g1~~TRINITY_DN37382_c0_g1_i1.p1  ORF type:complete len:458 (+),score=45.26 TRINITY_DN37382_c0_g1_i1:83-1375(+)